MENRKHDHRAVGSTYALEVQNLSKTFSGARVLHGVDIGFRRSVVTALLGPNGCGKSTLVKIVAGFHDADHGARIEIGGKPVSIPLRAKENRERGLRFLHQDLALVPDQTVADNFAFADGFGGQLGLSPVRRNLLRDTRRALEKFGLEISPRAKVSELGRTDQVMVAVARAFDAQGLKPEDLTIILDEPTASLPANSVDRVLGAVRRIREEGGSVIYVSHRLDEVMQIADDVVVLRDGRVVAQQERRDLSVGALAELISGPAVAPSSRSEAAPAPAKAPEAGPVLNVEGLSSRRLRDIDFEIASGETLGVAGLAGCGRSELARVISGVTPLREGVIRVDGAEVSLGSPHDALDQGIAYVPPDRAAHGVIGDLSVAHNLMLPDLSPLWRRGLLSRGQERAAVDDLIKRFNVQPPHRKRRMRFLSGGNQQKVVLAKCLRLNPKILVADEPTQGVDVRGKREIGGLLREAASERGCAVMVLSSDFDEIAELCDRILVLDRGEMVGIFGRGQIHERDLAMLSTNQKEAVQQ